MGPTRTTGLRSLTALVGAPPLLLALGALSLLLAAAAGRHPLWPRSTLSLSEAVYLGDQAAVARLLAEGQDPNSPRRCGRSCGPGRRCA